MRIVETFDVIFRGDLKGLEVPYDRTFYIQPDEGAMFEVQIPKIQHIIETFIYMSANDCLRHLKDLAPVFTTNIPEIQEIQHQNAMIEEHAYLSNSFTKSINAQTFVPQHNFHGTLPVPKPVYEAKWTFWSREHAVMTKLAQGGNL